MAERIASLAAGFGTADLRRAQTAWALAELGNWAFMVVLAIYAFDVGGAGAVGLAAGLRMLPAAVAAPFVTRVVDRRPRRGVVIGCLIRRAASLAALTGLVVADAPLAAVLVLAAAFSIVSTIQRPAMSALLPSLARTPQQLAAANAVGSAISNGGFLVGALAGGALAAAVSVDVAFAAAAAAFLLAALAMRGVAHDGAPLAAPPDDDVAREVAAGLRALVAAPQLRVVLAVFAVATAIEGATDVFIVLLALDLLDLGRQGVGFLNAAWGVGGLVGGAVAAAALVQGRLALGLCGGCVLVAATLALLGAGAGAAAALVLLAVLGVGYAFIEVGETTLLQRLLPDDVLGRAFGVAETVYVAATGVGSLLAPVVVAALGARGAMLACGAALAAVALAAWPALARFESAVPVGEREFALLRGVPFLALLPLAVVESLARHAVPVAMAAGDVVVREGDHGDRFYVIDTGEVTVSEDGDHRRVEGPGEFFGEIALLRDVPRTATVVATRPGALLAIERDDFLAAVTGLRRAEEAAGAVVDDRLATA